MQSSQGIEAVGAAAPWERNEWQDAIIMSWGVQNGKQSDRAERAIAEACLKAVDFSLATFPKGTAFEHLHVQAPAMPVFLGTEEASFPDVADQAAREEDMARLTDEFMKKVFIPRAASTGAQLTDEVIKKGFIPRSASTGAQVHSTVVPCPLQDSNSVGKAICDYCDKNEPAALVMMKENKGAIARFFIGSNTKYCATNSAVPVVIVPEGQNTAA